MLEFRVGFGLRSMSSGKGGGKKLPLLAAAAESMVSPGRVGAGR